MKKLFSIILLALALFILGCGKGPYSIEKQYYKAQKQAEKIYKNPQASPPNQLERVVRLFDGFSRKYPKSKLAVDADFKIAGLYMVKEEYQEARAQLKKIMSAYEEAKNICAEAVFLTGKTYEAENKWPQALAQYNKILQDYPLTLKGISVPMYLIGYYKAKFQPDKMVEAAREAVSHYSGLAQKYPGSPLALRAQTLAAQCRLAIKDWQGAIDILNSVIDGYKGKVKMDGILMNIAMIYKRELKDDAKTKETLERLVRDYPQSKLAGGAQEALKNLNK